MGWAAQTSRCSSRESNCQYASRYSPGLPEYIERIDCHQRIALLPAQHPPIRICPAGLDPVGLRHVGPLDWERAVSEALSFKQVEGILVVEMNAGQMLDDVRLAVAGRKPVEFYGRMGGMMPFPDEVLGEIQRMVKGPLPILGHPRDRWLQRIAVSN